ncbi:MAG: hypothetical protein ABJA79_02995 [Parafilimonas sp.]
MMLRDSQKREKYEKINGRIYLIDKHFNNLPIRDNEKYRYIQIDTYPYIFEVFIGKDWGDFKPI